MPEQFKHQWPLSTEEKEAVWSQGTIVLDTNVLLHIYRLPPGQRDRLLQILESADLKQRLWIPHRVAEEFFRNRLSVIDEQIVSAKKLIATVNDAFKELFENIDKAVRKHHPLVDRAGWKDRLQETLNELRKEYEEATEKHPASIKDDAFLQRAKAIMDGRLGKPFDANEMEDASKEAKGRFERQIPPGYEDAKKKDFERAIGDYVIWKQVLLEMKQRQKHLVFVVDDEKTDWWLRRQGQLLGPRPELREEYTRETGHQVDFATSQRFVDWASREFKLGPQPDLVAALTDAMASTTLARQLRNRLTHDYPSLVAAWAASLGERGETAEHEEVDEDPEIMAEWFLANYEDPANSVPYESAEGGYQYIAGGPYDAREEISSNFPSASEEAVERAVDIVSRVGGPDWVRKEDY